MPYAAMSGRSLPGRYVALLFTRHGTDADDEDALALEVDILESIRQGLEFHAFPIMVLGSGRSTLMDKFQVVMYALMLEAGDSCASLAKYCSEFRTTTTDFGTEYN